MPALKGTKTTQEEQTAVPPVFLDRPARTLETELILVSYPEQMDKWFIIGSTPKDENSVYPFRWFASPLVIDEQKLTMQMKALMKTENPPFEPTVSVESELGFGSLWEDKGAGNLQGDFPWINYIITSTGINHIILSGRQATLDALSEQGAQAGVKTIKTSQRAEVRKAKISHMQPEPIRIQIVDEFIETVRRSEVHRPIFNGILASLTNPMKDGKPVVGAEKYTESDAHNILRILMYKHIKPYFVSTERFFNKPSMTILILRDPFIRT